MLNYIWKLLSEIHIYISEIFVLTGSNKKYIFKIVIFGILLGLLDIVSMLLLSKLISLVISTNNLIINILGSQISLTLANFGFFLVLVYFIRMILGFYLTYKVNIYSGNIEANLKSVLLYKFQLQKLSNVKELSFGERSTTLNLWTSTFSKSILAPSGKLISDVVISFIIMSYFIYNYPKTMMLFISFSLLTIYGYIKVISKISTSNSRKFQKSVTEASVIIDNALSNYREVLTLNLPKYFSDQIKIKSVEANNAQAIANTISSSPRFFIESILILVAVTFLVVFSSLSDSNIIQALPNIAMLSIFLLRIASLSSLLTATLTNLKYYRNMINLLFRVYSTPVKSISKNRLSQQFKELKIKNLSLNISSKKIIKNLNFDLKSGSNMVIFGKSGSGKSTLIDIILGLIKPTNGNVIVITKNLIKTSNIINLCSYVSENPFLINASIQENIALGNLNQINVTENIISALKIAGLDEFSNKDALNVIVGSRGNRLSLGQRQRLSLARAIYSNKDVIVLDEATNAVDLQTDIAIMKRLLLLKNTTIIAVTHRAEVAKLFKQKLLLA
jgi:ABC-type multidrug transport system fused ATPase/permease subunit